MNDTRWLTLTRLKRRLNVENIALTEGDTARMDSALNAAQAEVEASTGRKFAPVYATMSHWAHTGQSSLLLRDDLLELTTVFDVNSRSYIANDVVWDTNSIALKAPNEFAGGEVRVTGWWAHHPAPTLAFRDSGDALSGNISNVAVTIPVSNAAGSDVWGDTPRFMAGQLLRIESELVRVVMVSGNNLQVRRGENGTAAVTHFSGRPIQVYVPGFMVEALGLRLAAWLYREPDAENGREWPQGINNAIAKLRRIRI